MIVWGNIDDIREQVANVPENWLRQFAVDHEKDCRKFAKARNGSMLYRSEAVLAAVEAGENMPNGGIVIREA